MTATIDLASVDTGIAKRDEHVRSADFLDVEKYPTMSYRPPACAPTAATTSWTASQLRGLTKSVPLKLEIGGFGPDPFREDDPFKGARAGFTATGEISRLEFGVGDTARVPGGGGLGRGEDPDHPGDPGRAAHRMTAYGPARVSAP